MGADLSEVNYRNSGVSIHAQNAVNSEIARRLKAKGMKAEGLFGGAVDISKYKNEEKVTVGLEGYPLVKGNSFLESGMATAKAALKRTQGIPIGTLDYIASSKMSPDSIPDFVEGIATESAIQGVPVLGGESAEMPGTYTQEGWDAFAHVVTIQGPGVDISDKIRGMRRPLIVATTDGTGTKTKIVRNPEDIIYHGSNDLGPQGVKPLAFAIYLSGNVSLEELIIIDKKSEDISRILGIKKLPTIFNAQNKDYLPGEVDIAGTVIGVIDQEDLITGQYVRPGDRIIGFAVDGLGTNGYSLLRKCATELVNAGVVKDWDTPMKELKGLSINEALSKPHRPMTDILFGYEGVEGILSKFKGYIHGQAHITGGGQEDNSIRMVPDNCRVEIIKGVLPVPPIMQLPAKYGVKEEALFEALNMGIGYTITVDSSVASEITSYVNTHFRYRIPGVDRQAAEIGEIKYREPKFRWAGKI